MPETTLIPEPAESAVIVASSEPSHRRRLLALCLLLSVSLTHFIFAAFYSLFHQPPDPAAGGQIRLAGALIAEITSLSVLWYLVSERGRSWTQIGWNPHWRDIPHGIVLIFVSSLAVRLGILFFQLSYSSFTGHYLQPRVGLGLLGAKVSALSAVLVVVNPFFEELIVRGFTMSEVIALDGSRNLAICLSVLIQMSYHVYQGLLRCLGLTIVFTIFSIYFARTRRLAPVVLAHFWSDLQILIRHSG